MNRSLVVSVISGVLILLWVYAALSKLLDYEQSRLQMMNQVFPHEISQILVWGIPAAELATSVLLVQPKTRLTGLYCSAFLLASFTVYISLIISHVFARVPCSCGGILEKMNWSEHLAFNIFVIITNSVAIVLAQQKTFNQSERRYRET